MKTNGLFIIVLLLVLGAVALVPSSVPIHAQDDGDVLAIIAADYPLVDGSTSAGPLQKVIACTIYDVTCLWTTYGWEPNFFVMAGLTPQGFDHPELHRGLRVINRIYHYGTHTSYMALISGEAEFILVARQPSDDELASAADAGVTLDVQAVALDAFVFLANTANPIDSLTIDEIRSIYVGHTISWTELGVTEPIVSSEGDYWDDPVENAIHAYTRNPTSGSQQLMETLVMQDLPILYSPDLMQSNMGAPVLAVDYDGRGIGYSVFFYARFMHPATGVKLLGVDGVLPTSTTIAERSYPLVTKVFAVVRDDMPADSTAILLRDWLLTPDGQAAVAASGYVPLLKP